MTDFMRQWIISVSCGAMFISVFQKFLPKKGIGVVGRLAGGLVLLIVTVQPLLGLDMENLMDSLETFSVSAQLTTDELTELNQEVLKEIIEEETEAYILDKAKEMEFECRASVICEQTEDGILCPVEVEISGSASDDQIAQLSHQIEEDLGIARQRQVYKRAVE